MDGRIKLRKERRDWKKAPERDGVKQRQVALYWAFAVYHSKAILFLTLKHDWTLNSSAPLHQRLRRMSCCSPPSTSWTHAMLLVRKLQDRPDLTVRAESSLILIMKNNFIYFLYRFIIKFRK